MIQIINIHIYDINININLQTVYHEYYICFDYVRIYCFSICILDYTGCCCGKARTNEVAKKKLQKDLEKVRQKYKKEGLKNKKKKN